MVQLLTILFAEDDAAVRDVVVEMLSAKGFRVLVASDGHEAVRLLAEHHVDLLFTDIVMPGMDGVHLARQAKFMHPAIKVLFATGYAPRAAEREAMHHGRLLFKPVRSADLVRQIEGLLAAR
jgi:two-component system cell cycle response regulator CpdR